MQYWLRSIFLISFLLSITMAKAQNSFCLPEGDNPNSIVFDAAAFHDFLHTNSYKAIVWGEQHNTSFDPEIKYHLITSLNKLYGIRDVFMEIGIAAAWHYNSYLQTGDTSMLYNCRLMYSAAGYRQFWQRLYEYNKLLPGNAKIIIHGMDFERKELLHALSLLAKKPVPASLLPVADTIAKHLADPQLNMYRKDVDEQAASFHNLLKFIQTSLLANESDACIYYGSNYPLVKAMISNDDVPMVKPFPRNKTMFKQLKQVVEDEHIQKFILFAGTSHTRRNFSSSLSNTIPGLKGFSDETVLTINEELYNTNIDAHTSNKLKELQEKVKLSHDCKAKLFHADDLKGYHSQADFIIIAERTDMFIRK